MYYLYWSAYLYPSNFKLSTILWWQLVWHIRKDFSWKGGVSCAFWSVCQRSFEKVVGRRSKSSFRKSEGWSGWCQASQVVSWCWLVWTFRKESTGMCAPSCIIILPKVTLLNFVWLCYPGSYYPSISTSWGYFQLWKVLKCSRRWSKSNT